MGKRNSGVAKLVSRYGAGRGLLLQTIWTRTEVRYSRNREWIL